MVGLYTPPNEDFSEARSKWRDMSNFPKCLANHWKDGCLHVKRSSQMYCLHYLWFQNCDNHCLVLSLTLFLNGHFLHKTHMKKIAIATLTDSDLTDWMHGIEVVNELRASMLHSCYLEIVIKVIGSNVIGLTLREAQVVWF